MKKKLIGALITGGIALSLFGTMFQMKANEVPAAERQGLTQLEYDVMYRLAFVLSASHRQCGDTQR